MNNNILDGLSNQQLSVFNSNSNRLLISSCVVETEVISRFAYIKYLYKNILLTTFTNK